MRITMKLNFKQRQDLTLPSTLFKLLNTEFNKLDAPTTKLNAITFNFRDINYSASNGGYHPVEIRIEKALCNQDSGYWKVVYITDFSYQGIPYPELVKEIDACFTSNQIYSSFTGALSPSKGQALLTLFINNFIEYYTSEAYKVTTNNI